jgi:hypothetical protein
MEIEQVARPEILVANSAYSSKVVRYNQAGNGRTPGDPQRMLICVVLFVEGLSVNRRIIACGAILALMGMVFFVSWPIWKSIKFRPCSAALYQRTKAAVDKDPRLKPAWDIALQDDVLTYSEAKIILESAGEKVEPED